jgi:hypothetical protein
MGRKHGASRKRAAAKQPSRRKPARLASIARDRRGNQVGGTPAEPPTNADYGQRKAGHRES